jgi:SAM-dependent methyltransferase
MAHPAWRKGNILDVRPAADFQAGHCAGAVSLPLPHPLPDPSVTSDSAEWTEIFAGSLLSIFLPPKHEPLLVISNQADLARAVASYLRGRGRSHVDATVMTTAAMTAWPPELVATGVSPRQLWRAPDFLVRHLNRLPPPGAGPVLDLGAGNGRAAVWLATHGYEVTAVDRYEEALTMGRRLAESRGVDCRFICRDLRDREQVPHGPWAVVLAFRYLPRPLLRDLPALLLPHGVVMVRTYRWVAGVPGLPSAQHCLQPGELLELFPTVRYEVLVHEENRDAAGQPAAGIVARLRLQTGYGGRGS